MNQLNARNPLKRSYAFHDLGDYLKKQKVEEITFPPVAFAVQKILDFEHEKKNCLWMHSAEIERIFSSKEASSGGNDDKRVKLGNRIYEIKKSDSLDKNVILIPAFQKKDLVNAIFHYNNQETVFVEPIGRNKTSFPSAKSILFSVYSEKQISLNIHDLKLTILEYTNAIISLKHSFTFEIDGNKVVINVKEIEGAQRKTETFYSFDAATAVEFENEKNVDIYQYFVGETIEKIAIDIHPQDNQCQDDQFLIHKQDMLNIITNILADELCYINKTCSFKYDGRLFSFKIIWINKKEKESGRYLKSYLFSGKTMEIIVALGEEIRKKILFYDNSIVAKIIELKVESVREKEKESSNGYINAKKLVERLRSLPSGFMVDQTKWVAIDEEIDCLIKVKKIDLSFQKTASSYLLKETTDLKITARDHLQLVDNETVHKVSALFFSVSHKHSIKILMFDEKVLERKLRKKLEGPLFKGQQIALKLLPEGEGGKENLLVRVTKMETEVEVEKGAGYGFLGEIDGDSVINFSWETTNLKKLDATTSHLNIDELGGIVGGVRDQLQQIKDSIILSRSAEAVKMGIRARQGVLLYGPPGTGKTLLARKLGAAMGCTEENGRLIMVAAAEMLNKWQGESERLVRELFAPAKKAQRDNKEGIYLIVIDEADALLRKRSGREDDPRNSIVSQFLSELDGLEQLKNAVVVLTTNMHESIDPAVLRPWRVDLKLNIPFPTPFGRKEIFDIYLRKLEKNNYLGNVDSTELAARTINFSGAEIEAVVANASLASIKRLQGAGSCLVTMEDLCEAVDKFKETPCLL